MCECVFCEKKIQDCCSLKEFVDSPKSEYALLIGNGLLLSYPSDEKYNFKFNYTNIQSNLLKSLIKILEDKEFNPECPEKLLNLLRIEVVMEILKWYKAKFEGFSPGNKKLHNFISNFSNIFTLNYDSVTYRAIFIDNGKETLFNDGFVQPEGIPSRGIAKYFNKNKRGLFYLHGAFHIIYMYVANPSTANKSNHLYKKIKAIPGKLDEKIINEHQQIEKKYRDLDLDGSKDYEDIFCVLESRSMYKKAWIENDEYLKFCFDRLGDQNKVLTLGCSFSNDDHILEKILLNPNLDSLKIGIYSDDDKKNLCKAYRRIINFHPKKDDESRQTIEANANKVSYICTKGLGNLLWDDVT